MGKLTIRTGGFVFWFYSILIILLSSALIFYITSEENIFTLIVGIIIFGWLIGFLIVNLIGIKIVLTDNKLILKMWKKGLAPGNTGLKYPKTFTKEINLQNINTIIFAKGKYFDELSKRNNDAFLKKQLKMLKEGLASIFWSSEKHATLIYIKEKNGNQYLIRTLSFSKKKIKYLISEIKKKGVDIIIKGSNFDKVTFDELLGIE